VFYTKYFVRKLVTISCNFFFVKKKLQVFLKKKIQNKIERKYEFFLVVYYVE